MRQFVDLMSPHVSRPISRFSLFLLFRSFLYFLFARSTSLKFWAFSISFNSSFSMVSMPILKSSIWNYFICSLFSFVHYIRFLKMQLKSKWSLVSTLWKIFIDCCLRAFRKHRHNNIIFICLLTFILTHRFEKRCYQMREKDWATHTHTHQLYK